MFSPKDCTAVVIFAKSKMGQEDDGSGNGKGGTLHVGQRRDSAEDLSGGTR